MFKRTFLVNNSSTLSDYKITANSEITIIKTSDKILNINIMMNNKTHNVDVAVNSNIRTYIGKFLLQFNKKKEDFYFAYNGEKLDEEKTFADYKIPSGERIFCIKKTK